MSRVRIACLFGGIATVALGSIALINPTALWQQLFVTLTVLFLLVATLAAFSCRTRRARCMAVAMAACGWIYLLVSFSPLLGLRDFLLTDKCIELLYDALHGDTLAAATASGRVSSVAFSPQGNYLVTSGTIPWVPLWNTSLINSPFYAIGHCLWTLVVAMAGGLAAGWLCQPVIGTPQSSRHVADTAT